jgi:Uncharacterised conserved protein (DUF2228)
MSSITPNIRLNEAYGFSFPADFYRCQAYLQALQVAGLQLQDAPLELQPGVAFQGFDEALDVTTFNPLQQSRYRFDPPEFFTVLGGNTDGLHWGYYSDHPEAGEWVVASYYHSDAYEFSIDGYTLLEAIRTYLERVDAGLQDYLATDAAHAATYRQWMARLAQMRTILMQFETGERPEMRLAYLEKYQVQRLVTAPNSAGMGLVVDGATYHETAEIAALFRKIHFAEADEQRLLELAAACIAQGYTGTALRIAQELWPRTKTHFPEVCALLDGLYTHLDRPSLRQALQAAATMR